MYLCNLKYKSLRIYSYYMTLVYSAEFISDLFSMVTVVFKIYTMKK